MSRLETTAMDERAILQALLRAGVPASEPGGEDLAWRTLAFDGARLRAELLALEGAERPGAAEALEALASDLAGSVRLRVARADDVPVNASWLNAGAQVSRPWLAEALGPLGSDLFPTRWRARRTATQAARELAYFGYGPVAEQALPSPLARIRQALGQAHEASQALTLLQEDGPSGTRRWSVLELLERDPYVHRKLADVQEVERFQQRLREDPLDGATVALLRHFFGRRVTVGLRDTLRWALGSRHPWFHWDRARELILSSFERLGRVSFVTPQFHLFTYDALLPDAELTALLKDNAAAVERFAAELGPALAEALPLGAPDQDTVRQLAEAALDYHHDYPDFDVESAGRQGGQTTVRFLTRAGVSLGRGLAGRTGRTRPNLNFEAHLARCGAASEWFATLDARGRSLLGGALRKLLRGRWLGARDGGLAGGGAAGYRRVPMLLYTFHADRGPHPAAGERTEDSFPLSELRAPQHARHLGAGSELADQLVVFYTLVLRHYLDTDHVPDLRPERLVRDFMVLGIWGYDTTNLAVNLYAPETGGVEGAALRAELSYLGRSHHVKRFRAEEDRGREGVLARKALARLGPLLEPSMLRSLGNVLMLVEEQERGRRPEARSPRHVVARHALEIFRETARQTLRGTLVYVATGLEMAVDEAVDSAQKVIDRFEPEPPPELPED